MVSKDNNNPTIKVCIGTNAFCSMMLHAAQKKNAIVHGVLLGSTTTSSKGAVTTEVVTMQVEAAVPLVHGTPTRPLLEIALGLIESTLDADANNNLAILGWYTAPMLLQETGENSPPNPVALRMTANLEDKDQKQPSSYRTLVVIQNEFVGKMCNGGASAVMKPSDSVKAFGQDFAKQYLEPLDVSVNSGDAACQAVHRAYQAKIPCNDFLDHLDGPASTSWYPNKDLDALVETVCKGE